MPRYIMYSIPVLVVISLLLVVGTAYADLKANNAVYAWDVFDIRFKNSQVQLVWDGGWVPFIHELNFDNDGYNPPSCGGGSTPLAGQMDFGLYHTDDAPAGAMGFQETRNWRLVDCDRDGDGRFDNDDLAAVPPQGFTLYRNLVPSAQDNIVDCSTGNCLNEIVTTLEVNIDDDCDGNPNADAPTLVCFYAKARVPDLSVNPPPYWSGPLQARVTAGGGDKTVNFTPSDPTAVTLLNFEIMENPPISPVWLVLLLLLILPALWLVKRVKET